VKSIIVLKPFALLYYSKKINSSPFESGVYNLSIKVTDSKTNKDLIIFKGDSLFKHSEATLTDTLKSKAIDSLKIKSKNIPVNKDNNVYSYNLGKIVAMFPNTNVEKLVKKNNSDFYKIVTQNGLQIFFSQRYQGDHFLNFVFTYF